MCLSICIFLPLTSSLNVCLSLSPKLQTIRNEPSGRDYKMAESSREFKWREPGKLNDNVSLSACVCGNKSLGEVDQVGKCRRVTSFPPSPWRGFRRDGCPPFCLSFLQKLARCVRLRRRHKERACVCARYQQRRVVDK